MSSLGGIRCMWMRGGTSKGAYFVRQDLPADTPERDAFLLRAMGSPDARQIDGLGGADPLTSKVAVVAKVPSIIDLISFARRKTNFVIGIAFSSIIAKFSLQVKMAAVDTIVMSTGIVK